MSLGVLLLVLAAAFAHAGWNFLAKGAEGGSAFVWLCAAVGTLLWVPVLGIALGTDPGALGWTALGLMVGQGAAARPLLRAPAAGLRGRRPVARLPAGARHRPLLSGAAAIVFLGETPSALAVVGALIIVGAVFSLVGRGGSREAIVFALLTGTTIATYTLWDKHAVGTSELERSSTTGART